MTDARHQGAALGLDKKKKEKKNRKKEEAVLLTQAWKLVNLLWGVCVGGG